MFAMCDVCDSVAFDGPKRVDRVDATDISRMSDTFGMSDTFRMSYMFWMSDMSAIF